MISIRNVREKDKKNLEKICIETAPLKAIKSEKGKINILLLYCNYYLRECKETSFTAVDEHDEAIGYIFCAPSYKKYKKEFKSVELKQLKKLGLGYYLPAALAIQLQTLFTLGSCAHMHIDILPQYTGKHIGTQLLNELKKCLSRKNINGIFLVVGASNKRAVSFYKKLGFKVRLNLIKGYLMKLKF